MLFYGIHGENLPSQIQTLKESQCVFSFKFLKYNYILRNLRHETIVTSIKQKQIDFKNVTSFYRYFWPIWHEHWHILTTKFLNVPNGNYFGVHVLQQFVSKCMKRQKLFYISSTKFYTIILVVMISSFD